MQQHVKILGILHIVWGGLSVLAGLGILALFGGLAGIVGLAADSSDSLVAIPILGGIGAFLFFMILLISLPGIVCGFGLLGYRPWSRMVGIVISAFELLSVPFGTALGIYGLWVLLSTQTEALFRSPAALRARVW